MAPESRCWCGSDRLTPFGEHYLSCEDCDTLIAAEPPAGDVTRVGDDERGFYGRGYFFERQEELDHPDVETRARNDLAERCLTWLRTALGYRRPPGRTLELGCSHGGFVALLEAAGFDAAGLELSPWMVGYARRTAGVTVLQGPLEDQDLEPRSFDLIAAMDVIEHLPDPAATIGLAVDLLKEDGVLLIQTPSRPAGKSHRQLVAAGDRFLDMLLPGEHLHLFSEDGVRRLLHRLGAPHVVFEPPLFEYDMYFAASPAPLRPDDAEDLHVHLCASPAGCRLLAMLDLRQQLDQRTRAYLVADRDRVGRQAQIEELHRLLNREKAERLEVESLLRQELDRCRRETEERRQTIGELQRRSD